MVWSSWKNVKAKKAWTNCNSYNGRDRQKMIMEKMERWGRRGLYMGIKKQTCNGQRPSGMEEDCSGSQGPQWTVVLEKMKSIARLSYTES